MILCLGSTFEATLVWRKTEQVDPCQEAQCAVALNTAPAWTPRLAHP